MAIDSVTERNSLATKFGTDVLWAALFNADPGGTGSVANEISGGSYARKLMSWSAASNGTISATVLFDVPADATLRTYYAGVCTASTGANLVSRGVLSQQAFGTPGQYQVTINFQQI